MKRSWLLLIVLLLTTTCIATDVNWSDEIANHTLADDGFVVTNGVVMQTSSEYLLEQSSLKSTNLAEPLRIGPPPDPFPTEPDEPVSVNGGLFFLLLCVVVYGGLRWRKMSCQ